MQDSYFVLFLSQRDSVRSLMAEAVLNKIGAPRFHAASAGVRPAETVDEMALEVLKTAGYDVSGLEPKHFEQYAAKDARELDFVFTLSDTAAGEPLPEWPGQPISAHWSSPDPTKVTGEPWERRKAYVQLLGEMERRLGIFINLPFTTLDRMSLHSRIAEIG